MLITPPQFEGGELETEAEVVANRGAKRRPAEKKKKKSGTRIREVESAGASTGVGEGQVTVDVAPQGSNWRVDIGRYVCLEPLRNRVAKRQQTVLGTVIVRVDRRMHLEHLQGTLTKSGNRR